MRHIWIFQLGSAPVEASKATLLQELDAFIAVWKAHGSPVPGTAELRHDRFVVVQAEPDHASGCSIDSMTKGVQEILSRHGLEVLGAERVFYRASDGSIQHIDFKEAKAAIADGRLQAGTILFDSTLGNSNDLSRWEVPMEQTWMARFLVQRV
jgi:hypothetical protein